MFTPGPANQTPFSQSNVVPLSLAWGVLREQVLHMLLGHAGCAQELRVQLTQGGHPWPRLAGTRWWDMMEAAGFFLQDRDPSSTGGACNTDRCAAAPPSTPRTRSRVRSCPRQHVREGGAPGYG